MLFPSSSQDYYAIQEIQSDKNVFRLIVGYVYFHDTTNRVLPRII